MKIAADDSINNAFLIQLQKSWKCAKVVTILKARKDTATASNYRPISKIFEKITLNRLQSFITTNNILNDDQFGFRAGHSTDHQLLRVTNYIKKLLKIQSVGMVTFYIETAFDSVRQKGRLQKVFLLKFPLYLIKIVQSFLQKRSFYVSINGHESRTFHIQAGVTQGSVLSPTLCNIFTSDLNISHSENAFFADDSCICISAKSLGKIIRKLNAAGK